MGIFSTWILQIVGVVVLGVLVDVILPEGQTNKYIKSIFAIITVLVIVSPIPKVITMNIEPNIDSIVQPVDNYVDDSYLEFLKKLQCSQTEDIIVLQLEAEGYSVNDIEVEYDEESEKFVIKKIYIELDKSGINWEMSHINIISKVKQLVFEVVNINSEKVEVDAK